MKRYLVLAMRNPAFDPGVVDAHRRFLAEMREEGRIELSGPFTDASGGAYLLNAGSLDEATAIAHRDPLHVTRASTIVVREWSAT